MNRLSIAQKITIFNIFGSLVGMAAMVAMALWIVEAEMEEKALQTETINIELVKYFLAEKGPLSLRDGKLYAGDDYIIGEHDHEIVDTAKKLTTATFTIFAGDVRASTNVIKDGKRAVGTPLAKSEIYDRLYVEKKPFIGLANVLGQDFYVHYEPLFNQQGDMVGSIVAGLKAETFLDAVDEVTWRLVLVGILSAIFVTVGLYILITRQLQGLALLTRIMGRLAGNDHSVDVPETDRGDDVGEIARAVEIFKNNGIEREQLEAAQRGEENRRQERQVKVEQLTSGFNNTIRNVLDNIGQSVSNLHNVSETMNATADLTSRESASASSITEQAAANIETVSTATRQLTSSIQEISEQVSRTSSISREAVQESEGALANVEGLAEAASRIGEVVNLINDIAAQTNLLALNATIEAARAGEAGKGFAVVASEVKSLANQTARATEEIASQVTGIQQATHQSVDAIKSIATTITRINELSADLASAVEEQSAATGEIARNVDEASRGTTEVTRSITNVAEKARETERSAQNVSGAADLLREQSGNLRDEVTRFLNDVTAA